MHKQKTKNIVTAAVFTAIIAILSQIAVPLPSGVPITLQTFAIALCGYVLGPFWGFASITAYVLLGAIGVPVFSAFGGGISRLFGPTGGFIFGFMLFAPTCGLAKKHKNPTVQILLGLSGMLICHLIGTLQYAYVYKTEFIASFLLVSAPYLIKDAASVILAWLAAKQINKRLNTI